MAGVSVNRNVVTVVHEVAGDANNGASLAARMVGAVENLRGVYMSVVVYHDASAMEDAGPAYARAFGEAFLKLREYPGCSHVALIPKLWLRALAGTAATIGGVELKTFKATDQAEAFVRERIATR